MKNITGLLAFTLAEVLIVLSIIGIVADMTIPTLISNVNEKALKTAKQVAALKFEEVMNQMRANDKLTGYASADAFAKEFVKYMKTVQRCDSDSLTNCFIDKIKTSDDEEVETGTLKTGANIALENPENYPSNNVAITFPNGIMAIVNYSNVCEWKNPLTGGGASRSEATKCLSMIYDVNGRKKPNQVGEDIVTLNAKIQTLFDCKVIGSICVATSDIPYSPISEAPYLDNNNHWAGAKKACAALHGRLPTRAELERQAVNDWFKNVPPGEYWVSDLWGDDPLHVGQTLNSATGVVHGFVKGNNFAKLRCVR